MTWHIKQKCTSNTTNCKKTQTIKSQIMKKLATTFGLLALMLIVTSFTTASEIGGGKSSNGGLNQTNEIGGGKSSNGGLNQTNEIGGGKSSNGGLNLTNEIGGGKSSNGGLNLTNEIGGGKSSNGGLN